MQIATDMDLLLHGAVVKSIAILTIRSGLQLVMASITSLFTECALEVVQIVELISQTLLGMLKTKSLRSLG